jgi:hypothetical protein
VLCGASLVLSSPTAPVLVPPLVVVCPAVAIGVPVPNDSVVAGSSPCAQPPRSRR